MATMARLHILRPCIAQGYRIHIVLTTYLCALIITDRPNQKATFFRACRGPRTLMALEAWTPGSLVDAALYNIFVNAHEIFVQGERGSYFCVTYKNLSS